LRKRKKGPRPREKRNEVSVSSAKKKKKERDNAPRSFAQRKGGKGGSMLISKSKRKRGKKGPNCVVP